jgi:HAE1 family hydrophobic/amphiphilic exporter-1
MDEVGGALIAIALTLCAVFVPAAFIAGISGEFFRQFAVTIAASTIISCFVSLTLSPALCAVLLLPRRAHSTVQRRFLLVRLVVGLFSAFNRGFEWLSDRFGQLTSRLVRLSVVVLIAYAGLTALTGWQFSRAPTGFIPQLDQGYLITVLQLPPGSSLARTDAVTREVNEILTATPGVASTAAFAGLAGATLTLASNEGAIFSVFKSFEERDAQGLTADVILASINKRLAKIDGAFVITILPPPINGIGNAGGFKMMLEDKKNLGPAALEAAAQELAAAANADPRLSGVFSPFTSTTPNVYADIDRFRAAKLGVPAQRVFEALQVYLGSAYINDFNYLGRTYQVMAQADEAYRLTADDIGRYKTRNDAGEMVPIGSVATFHDTAGPYRVPRYNQFPAAEVQGNAAPGVSSGTAVAAMEQLAALHLPDGIGYEWTDLSYEQKQAGNTAIYVFGASSSAEPLPAILARSSWLFSSSSLLAKPRQRKFISSPIISRLIVPPRSGNSWSEIVMFASITHQPTPPGSTKLSSGFPKSSVMSSPAASSSRLKILIGNSSATSVATTKRPNPSSGLTPKLIGAFAQPRNQCNAALVRPISGSNRRVSPQTRSLLSLFSLPAPPRQPAQDLMFSESQNLSRQRFFDPYSEEAHHDIRMLGRDSV